MKRQQQHVKRSSLQAPQGQAAARGRSSTGPAARGACGREGMATRGKVVAHSADSRNQKVTSVGALPPLTCWRGPSPRLATVCCGGVMQQSNMTSAAPASTPGSLKAHVTFSGSPAVNEVLAKVPGACACRVLRTADSARAGLLHPLPSSHLMTSSATRPSLGAPTMAPRAAPDPAVFSPLFCSFFSSLFFLCGLLLLSPSAAPPTRQ